MLKILEEPYVDGRINSKKSVILKSIPTSFCLGGIGGVFFLIKTE
ncbi:MAG: hypothetical protein ACI9SJ_000008 [Flavobacteriaceae bacterium]|jgi:hypothetical protein